MTITASSKKSTKISWTDATWNPTVGCSHVSDGCRHCYAEDIALRWGWSKKPWTAANARDNVILKPERLREPYGIKAPKKIFVNSMSDLFHELIPDAFLDHVFDTMINTPRHAYQILTKRPERAAKWPGPWMLHIWLGTSVENRHELHRIGTLQHSQAQRRFLSLEPLLEDLGPLDLSGIHWVIVGGESGKIHRPMDHAWARAIRDQCVARGIPLWFKQSAARYSEQDIFLQEADGSAGIWRYMPTWNDRL